MSHAYAITAVSSYTANHYKTLGIELSLITVINNKAAPIKNWNEVICTQYNLDGKKIILTLFRLIKHKGQDNFLKSLP
jgi:hypothetical protein